MAALALMAAFAIFYGWARGRGAFGWTDSWFSWTMIIGCPALLTLIALGDKVSAGADWMMNVDTFVKTYELVAVTATRGWNGAHIEFVDMHGAQSELRLQRLQLNPALWDLVYNGILHSVANGARVNDVAIDELQLHHVMEQREPPPPWMGDFRPNIDNA